MRSGAKDNGPKNALMPLDLRIPIGLLFSLLGILLAGYGVVSEPSLYRVSLGLNINGWWGAAMLVFGGAMLAAARHSAHKAVAGRRDRQ